MRRLCQAEKPTGAVIGSKPAGIPLRICVPQCRNMADSSGIPTMRRSLPYYLPLLLVIVFFSLIRWHFRYIPLERDEGEYAYAGQLMLHGIPPYTLMYSMKLPGTFAAYAAILLVFGQTAKSVHLGLLVVNAITTFLIFLLGKRLFGP